MRPGKLEALHALAHRMETDGVPGIFLEAGVAMGGSAIVIAKSKARERELRLYDAFALPPPPSARDDARSHVDYQDFVDGHALSPAEENYLLYRSDLMAFTRDNLRRAGVHLEAEHIRLIKGVFEDTLRIEQPVAFAHVDCDWHDSVKLCIDHIATWVSPGGIMLFDDYSAYEGAAKAVNEWLPLAPDFHVVHSEWTLGVQRSG